MEVFEHGMTPFPEIGASLDPYAATYVSNSIRRSFGSLPPRVGRIIRETCDRHNVTPEQLRGPRGRNSISIPRQLLMCRLYTETHMSLLEVAKLLNRKDHTSVMNALNKYGVQ